MSTSMDKHDNTTQPQGQDNTLQESHHTQQDDKPQETGPNEQEGEMPLEEIGPPRYVIILTLGFIVLVVGAMGIVGAMEMYGGEIVEGDGTHLVVLLHGFGGAPRDMRPYIQKAMEMDRTKKHFTFFVSSKNQFFGGLSRVEYQAQRVFDDMQRKFNPYDRPSRLITKLSIVGVSLGGVVGVHLAKLLEKDPYWNTRTWVSYQSIASPHRGLDPGQCELAGPYIRHQWKGIWPVHHCKAPHMTCTTTTDQFTYYLGEYSLLKTRYWWSLLLPMGRSLLQSSPPPPNFMRSTMYSSVENDLSVPTHSSGDGKIRIPLKKMGCIDANNVFWQANVLNGTVCWVRTGASYPWWTHHMIVHDDDVIQRVARTLFSEWNEVYGLHRPEDSDSQAPSDDIDPHQPKDSHSQTRGIDMSPSFEESKLRSRVIDEALKTTQDMLNPIDVRTIPSSLFEEIYNQRGALSEPNMLRSVFDEIIEFHTILNKLTNEITEFNMKSLESIDNHYNQRRIDGYEYKRLARNIDEVIQKHKDIRQSLREIAKRRDIRAEDTKRLPDGVLKLRELNKKLLQIYDNMIRYKETSK